MFVAIGGGGDFRRGEPSKALRPEIKVIGVRADESDI
jgi:hypothetical protein